MGGAWTTYASGFTGTVVYPAFDSSGHLFVGEDAKIEEYVGGLDDLYERVHRHDRLPNLRQQRQSLGGEQRQPLRICGWRTDNLRQRIHRHGRLSGIRTAASARNGRAKRRSECHDHHRRDGHPQAQPCPIRPAAAKTSPATRFRQRSKVAVPRCAPSRPARYSCPGASQPCTLPATSSNLGVNTISLTASDPNSSNGSQATAATLTVLDHANASLSSTASQTSQTIDFGSVLAGASIPRQSFTIDNRAAHTSAAYTANLKLTGFSTSGDPALTTNLLDFQRLGGGQRRHIHRIAEHRQSYDNRNQDGHDFRFAIGR